MRPKQRLQHRRAAAARPAAAPQLSIEERRRQNGGFSEPPPNAPYVDYPLIVTKKDLKEALRFHVMRFGAVAEKNESVDGIGSVDPSDPDQFTRPVTLSRRDPRQPPIGRNIREQAMQQEQRRMEIIQEPVNEEEAARSEAVKAERDAQRARDLAQIAPVAKDPNAPSKKAKDKKPKQEKLTAVFRRPGENFQKESELRYEESLPWHLEDADGKNVWVGSYVGPLSEAYAALIIDGSSFRMLPLEKYYKFKAKPPFVPYSIEQAENIMNKKAEIGRWAMLQEEKAAQRKEMQESRGFLHGTSKIKGESRTFKNSNRTELADHDELDMSGDEFDDDDEAPTLERDNDEDFVEAQKRIRRDQLGANLFGHGDEDEVDRLVKQEQEEEKERENTKAMRKMLVEHEREAVYETDSDHLFLSGDEEEEEEEDKDAKEEEGTEEEKKPAALSPTKGESSTLQPKKQPETTKKGKKRPGSPTLSDGSGNETASSISRKKAKKTGGPGTGTTVLPSRAPTPAVPVTDASRAGSPVAPPPSSPNTPLTREEILAVLPPFPQTIRLGALAQKFRSRIGTGPGQTEQKVFINMVKEICSLEPGTKLLKRKG